MLLDLESNKLILDFVDTKSYTTVADGRGNLKAMPVTAMDTKITWTDIPNTNQTSKVLLQKSTQKNSGYVTIHTFVAGLDPQQFVDSNANNTFHRHIVEWYRLVIPEAQVMLEPVCCLGTHDPVGAEIARRHMIRLKDGKCGNKCYVFNRMRDGARCPDCWDEITQELCASDCPTCNGTGYIQGYYNPLPIYLNFTPETATVSADTSGPVNSERTIQAWTGCLPDLSSGDVIIEPVGNRIWTVNDVQISTHRRLPVKQNITLDRSIGDSALWNLVKRLPEEPLDRGGGLRGY